MIEFLSCLRGREHEAGPAGHRNRFLSCLRGREPNVVVPFLEKDFLSCLRGREHNREKRPAGKPISKLPTRQGTPQRSYQA